jgi:TPP-dependent 2-oxoacid decarboxylase
VKWQNIPAAFGADATTARAANRDNSAPPQLTRTLTNTGRIRLIEVVLDMHDLPRVLDETCKAIAQRNS